MKLGVEYYIKFNKQLTLTSELTAKWRSTSPMQDIRLQVDMIQGEFYRCNVLVPDYLYQFTLLKNMEFEQVGNSSNKIKIEDFK